MRYLFLVIPVMMSISIVQAECVPTPCYVERIGVASCRPISEVAVDPDVLEPKRATALLEAASGVVVRGKIRRSRPLSQTSGSAGWLTPQHAALAPCGPTRDLPGVGR